MKKYILFAVVATLAATAAAEAQSDTPYAGYVYPAGGQIGSTFEVTVGGVNLDNPTEIHCTGEGIEFEILGHLRPINQGAYKELQNELYALINRQRQGEELTPEELARMDELYSLVATFDIRKSSIPAEAETVKLRVTIASDAEPGNRELRLQAENGLTNPLVYQVGESPEFSEMSVRDFVTQRNEEELRGARGKLQESDEKEDPGATPITTEPEVPSDISVPSVVNGQIPPGDYDLYRFQAASGQKLVLNAHARRLIPYVSDGVPGWFQATLTIYDAEGNEVAHNDDFRFHPDPVIYFEVPETGDYILEIRDSIYRGRESFVYRIEIGETAFVTSVFPLGGPAGTAQTVELRGWNLPVIELAVPPLEPGVTAVAAEYATFLPEGAPYAVGDLSEVMEQGANNEPSSADRVNLPVIVNGRISRSGDIDVFVFDADAGTEIVADVQARRLGSPLDSVLKLTSAGGEQLAIADDWYRPTEGLITHHADARLSVTLPDDGVYYLHIADAQHKGGAEYAYRLRIEGRKPDFELRAVPSSVNLRPGMTVPFKVHALRQNGFDGDINVAAELPQGFGIRGGLIPAGLDAVQMTLTAPLDPHEPLIRMTMSGSAIVDGAKVVRPVVPAQDLMQAFYYRHLVPFEELLALAAGDSNGFEASVELEDTLQIPIGGTLRVNAHIPRNSFYGPVKLMLLDPAEGIVIGDYTLDPRHCEIIFRSYADAVEIGQRGNLVVQAISKKGVETIKGKEQRKPEYVLLTALPAMPFEIVANDGYAIEATASGNGSVYPTYVTVEAGSDLTVRISPEDGFRLDTLTVDGVPVAAAKRYTFRNVTADHALAATFAPDPVNLMYLPAALSRMIW